MFVIGCGRWGTFIAWYLDKIGHTVSLYGREQSDHMKELVETRKNQYLTLPESINLTTSYQESEKADYIIISVCSQGLQEVVHELANLSLHGKKIVLCMKGIEIETGRRLSQIVSDTLEHDNKIAVWLGPGHVQEFYRGILHRKGYQKFRKSIWRRVADL